MNTIESSIGANEHTPKWNGRDLEIPPENQLGEQQLLMRLMVPYNIKPFVVESDGEKVGIEDGLFERWYVKYAKLFREYCNDLDLNDEYEKGLISRIVAGTLTTEDYIIIQKHLEDPANSNKAEGTGGLFFEEEADEQEFLKQYIH